MRQRTLESLQGGAADLRPPVTEMTELPDDPLGGASGKKRHFLAGHGYFLQFAAL